MKIFCHDPRWLVREHQLATSVHGNGRVAIKAENGFPLWIALLARDCQCDKVHAFRRGLPIVPRERDKEGTMGSRPKNRRYEVTLHLSEAEAKALYFWCERWITREQPTLQIAVLHILLMALNHAEELDDWTRAHVQYCDAEGVCRIHHLIDSIAKRPLRPRLKGKRK